MSLKAQTAPRPLGMSIGPVDQEIGNIDPSRRTSHSSSLCIVRPDSIGIWPYHDHGPEEMMSTNLGLFGAIVIRPREEPVPDVEHTIYFHMYQPSDIGARVAYSAINGRAYAGNTPTPSARVGQDVAFNVLTLGSELHTFHIHGHRWKDEAGAFADAPDLSPSQGLRARYIEDAPGRWLYHCHVMTHMQQGMVGYYTVSP